MVERREAVRIPLVVKVSLQETREAHYYFSRDVSIGGMFIETKESFPVGANVTLDFSLPLNGKQHQMKINGEIVRTVTSDSSVSDDDTPGMGVRFLLLSENFSTLLSEFINEMLSNQSSS